MLHGGTRCNTCAVSNGPPYTSSHSATPLVPTSKPRVGLTLDAEVYEEVKAIAKVENRSLSNLIESWVLAELAKRKMG
jgi:hypothetical protein